VTDFLKDRTSGSGDIGLGFLGALETWVATDRSGSPHALRAALLAFLREAQRAHPTMGLLHQLAARALDVADTAARREDTPPAIREALAASSAAERTDLADGSAQVARFARGLLTERETWIATLSSSGTVRGAIEHAHASGLAPRALVGEGRPLLEGRAMAAALARSGVPAWLVADAALPLLMSSAGMLWLGADAVTDQGAINKIGSFAAALAARERSVPVYVLASRRKFIPAGTPALRIVEQPPAEIWDAPPEGVSPRNIYFELVPMALIRGIVVEDTVLGGSEAATVARERGLPEALATV
jgi:translation initiation factor eIF-2B subunit delta